MFDLLLLHLTTSAPEESENSAEQEVNRLTDILVQSIGNANDLDFF